MPLSQLNGVFDDSEGDVQMELMSGQCRYSPNKKHFWKHVGFQDGDVIYQCEHCYVGHKDSIRVWK